MKNADRLIRDRRIVEKSLSRLTDGVMLDLCRRAGTRAEKDSTLSGPRASGTHSDPTLSAVVRKMSEVSVADPIFDS